MIGKHIGESQTLVDFLLLVTFVAELFILQQLYELKLTDVYEKQILDKESRFT